jgi:hypothetical protein
MKRSSLMFPAAALLLAATAATAGPLPGAIFTTTATGSRVNANQYAAKEDVYLDGGPGSNAPAAAAALPAGDYYFQVTDPSGKVLLSQDSVADRRFTVSAAGVITAASSHVTGTDGDHADLGARTVRLFPYADTPNPGGVYKVWATPVGRFQGDVGAIDNPGPFHGFEPSWSKTDTYKVLRRGTVCDPATICIRKFDDVNGDGAWGAGEPSIVWNVWVTDPSGRTTMYATPVTVPAGMPGTWTVREDTSSGRPTGSYVDGQVVSLTPYACPTVNVEVGCGCNEPHAVVFGNHFDCGCK